MKFLICLRCRPISFSSGITIITWHTFSIQHAWSALLLGCTQTLQTFACHCVTLLGCKKQSFSSATYVQPSLSLKTCMFLLFTLNLVQSILLYLTAAWWCFDSECWRSPKPGVITQWVTDWRALLSWPSQLQVNPNSLTMMDGSWQGTDSDWGRAWADLSAVPPPPLAKHFEGHCRSSDLCKQASPWAAAEGCRYLYCMLLPWADKDYKHWISMFPGVIEE